MGFYWGYLFFLFVNGSLKGRLETGRKLKTCPTPDESFTRLKNFVRCHGIRAIVRIFKSCEPSFSGYVWYVFAGRPVVAGIFFVEHAREEETAIATSSEDPDARDLAVVRFVLMEILPNYPEVLEVVRNEVRRRREAGP